MGPIRDTAPAALARATWAAHRPLSFAWWGLVVIRSLLPAALTLGLGALIAAVQADTAITVPLVVVTTAFGLLSVLGPIHNQVGAILGDRTSGLMQARLTDAVSDPPGIAHLERPGLADELVAARDFDLGMIGPPISVSMGFVAAGVVELLGGAAQVAALATVTWWGALIIAGAWLSSHWLLRESSFWARRHDPEVQAEQRHADYAYRLAVDAPPAKEVRVFGLGGWVVDRFAVRRSRLLDLQWEAMRLRQRSLTIVLVVLTGAYVIVLVPLISGAINGDVSISDVVVAAQALVGASALGVGGFTWALDAAAAPAKAVDGLAARMASEGALETRTSNGNPGNQLATGLPAREIRFRDVGFTYPSGGVPVYEQLNLTIKAGQSLAIVGRNGVGKTTLVKLLGRLYDPTIGSVEVDGIDLRSLDIESWREQMSVVFQDFVRFELSLRDNLVPGRTDVDDALLSRSLVTAGAKDLATLDQPLSKAYESGTDLSGGQWQRVALARALTAVEAGAGVVVLDEPTAQLDVRGEAEIFSRLLEATKGRTTILISHRFSTVRQADRIVVIDQGVVVEDGSHDELMAHDGLYHTMFELQAARFAEGLTADPADAELGLGQLDTGQLESGEGEAS